MSLRIFIHGLESSNQGTKSIFFKERFPDMVIPHFTGSLPERMEKLNRVLSSDSNIKLVGSSFGGLMASIFAMENEPRVDIMVLLAPAINLIGFSDHHLKEISVPVHIYHGIKDDVIPINSIERAAKKYFRNHTFHKVDDDHFLHNTFKSIDWDILL